MTLDSFNDSAFPGSPNNVFNGSPLNIRGKNRVFNLMLIGSTFNPNQEVNGGVDFDVLTPTSNILLTSGGNILALGACVSLTDPGDYPWMILGNVTAVLEGNVTTILPCSMTGTTDSTFYELGCSTTTVTNSYGSKSGGLTTVTNGTWATTNQIVSTAIKLQFVGPFAVNSGAADVAFPSDPGPIDVASEDATLTAGVLMPAGTYDFLLTLGPYGVHPSTPLWALSQLKFLITSQDGATTTVVPLTGSGLAGDTLTPDFDGSGVNPSFGPGSYGGTFSSRDLLGSNQEFYMQIQFTGLGQDSGPDSVPGVAGVIDVVIGQSLCGCNATAQVVFVHG